nr:hypothetical protein [Pedobacter panaciterrae]
MGSTEIKKENIKLREVYLEDLKSVMSLYQNSLAPVKHVNGSGKGLTSDFGLPIGIAEKEGKVIAYSRVNIDSKGKPVFQIHRNEAFGTDTVCENLNSFSVKRFTMVWGVDAEQGFSNKSIENAINRLVDWLNHCS